MRTKTGQDLHDSYVAALATRLINAGCQLVYSDLPGNQKPPSIGQHIPDVYAEKTTYLNNIPTKKEVFVYEVETNDTKNSIQTIFQINTFKSWAQSNNAVFEVIIAE